jgi:hypothetical protein
MNLKNETIEVINENGYNIDDIKWIGTHDFKIPIDLFWKLADYNYNVFSIHQQVISDLIIVGDTWWMERNHFDNAEWWNFHKVPEMPKETKKVCALTNEQYNKLFDYDNKVHFMFIKNLKEVIKE